MKFIYILVGLFFIGCQSQQSMVSKDELKNNSQLTARMKELKKKLEVYKAAYDGTIFYLNGVRNKDILSTQKAIDKFNIAITNKKSDLIYGKRKNPIIIGDKGPTYGPLVGDYRQSFKDNFELNYYLYLTLGKSYYNLCQIEDKDHCITAIEFLDKAIGILEKNPYPYKYPNPYYIRSMTYMVIKARKDFLEERFNETIKNHKKGKKYFEKILKKYVKKNIKDKGLRLRLSKKVSDSEFRVHSSLAVAYSNYGYKALSGNGQLNENSKNWFKAAKIEFLKVLIIDPENHSTFHNLALTESKLGEDRRAIENFNKSLFINPTNIASYIQKGYSLLNLGKQESACFNFNIAIKLDEKYKIQTKETYDKLKIDAKCP